MLKSTAHPAHGGSGHIGSTVSTEKTRRFGSCAMAYGEASVNSCTARCGRTNQT